MPISNSGQQILSRATCGNERSPGAYLPVYEVVGTGIEEEQAKRLAKALEQQDCRNSARRHDKSPSRDTDRGEGHRSRGVAEAEGPRPRRSIQVDLSSPGLGRLDAGARHASRWSHRLQDRLDCRAHRPGIDDDKPRHASQLPFHARWLSAGRTGRSGAGLLRPPRKSYEAPPFAAQVEVGTISQDHPCRRNSWAVCEVFAG